RGAAGRDGRDGGAARRAAAAAVRSAGADRYFRGRAPTPVTCTAPDGPAAVLNQGALGTVHGSGIAGGPGAVSGSARRALLSESQVGRCVIGAPWGPPQAHPCELRARHPWLARSPRRAYHTAPSLAACRSVALLAGRSFVVLTACRSFAVPGGLPVGGGPGSGWPRARLYSPGHCRVWLE